MQAFEFHRILQAERKKQTVCQINNIFVGKGYQQDEVTSFEPVYIFLASLALETVVVILVSFVLI